MAVQHCTERKLPQQVQSRFVLPPEAEARRLVVARRLLPAEQDR